MKLVLVRHGESEYNAQNILTGHHNPPLTEKGVIQATECGQVLSDIRFHHVFTSDLTRSIDTSNLILGQSSHTPKTNTQTPLLKEKSDGKLEGLIKPLAIKDIGQDLWKEWKRTLDGKPPEGESVNEIYKRVIKYYEDQIKPLVGRSNVLIVAHQYSILSLIIYLENRPLESVFGIPVKNAQPYIFDIRA